MDNQRRNFIFKSSMLVASGALTACGGGAGGAAGVGAAANLDTTPSSTPAANGDTVLLASSVQAKGTPLPNASFLLRGVGVVKAAPFCLGYAFARGDVPAGSTVASSTGTLQVTPKNTWPDGSLKFAVLAGQADSAATDTVVNLSVIPQITAVAGLKTAKLRATEIVAEIGCGTYGTVNWSGTDWDTPFVTWVSGNLMSSWIYRKPVGADKHLVAWLEVRLWSSGAVEVLPWIENGYVKVAAPTNKAATYTFTLGKTQRFSGAIDLKHHQRTPLISGAALSYWLSVDPGVTARPDRSYLQISELVPSYMAKVDPNASAVQKLVSTFTPLQAGNFNYDSDNMAASGYQDPIGLLPQHDVLYLTSDALGAYGAVVRNGFSAGRYGIHYRDENTNRPLRFSSFPTLNIGDNQGFKDTGGSTTSSYTPTPSGGNPPGWDVAHSPSVGYMAYLLTGRWYFMEEVQFATTANYLGNGDNGYLRTGSKGLVQTAVAAWQTRSCAWDWRARVQALAVTPDDDTALRSEFIASVEANIDHFHGRYVAQKNNPYGWIKPGEGYDTGIRVGAPWQQDFVTAAFGYAVSLGLPVSGVAGVKLAAFFQWKAKSAVMRLGPKGAFWYVNADTYTVAISPVTVPDYESGAGPWYASDAEVYAASFAAPVGWMGQVDGVLAGEIMPGAEAMWGNLVPAIAYAVRHNVPGAQDAYNRLTGASNWSSLAMGFNTRPVWSVRPSTMAVTPLPVVTAPVDPAPTIVGAPAWMAGAVLNRWIEIPGTVFPNKKAAESYSGMAVTPSGRIIIAASGGHTDGETNEVYGLDLAQNAPVWSLLCASSPTVTYEQPYAPDGKPSARHTYDTPQYVPSLNRVILAGAYAVANSGNSSFPTVDGFDLSTNIWDRAGTYAYGATSPYPGPKNGVYPATGTAGYTGGAYLGCMVDGSGNIWAQGGMTKFTIATNSWSTPTNTNVSTPRSPWAYDANRDQAFGMCYGDGHGYSLGLGVVAAKRVGNTISTVVFNSSPALTQFMTDVPTYAGMTFDPLNDQYLFYCGTGAQAGRVFVAKPNAGNTWDMTVLATSGSVPSTNDSGIQNRFQYVPSLKGVVMLPINQRGVFFMRTA